MAEITQKITPFLWYFDKAEEAAMFYVSIFSGRGERDSKILGVVRYPKVAEEVSGRPAGSVMTVNFKLAGQEFVAINGGEPFQLSEAVSFVVNCETQEEVDYYWEKLKSGGDEKSQICGWLKDKFGLSWQITPTILTEMIASEDKEKVERVMAAMLKMKKIIIADLQKAYYG